jgi:hypothetical protein
MNKNKFNKYFTYFTLLYHQIKNITLVLVQTAGTLSSLQSRLIFLYCMTARIQINNPNAKTNHQSHVFERLSGDKSDISLSQYFV